MTVGAPDLEQRAAQRPARDWRAVSRDLIYAPVGLALRALIARVFFQSGQEKILGPTLSLPLPDGTAFSFVLPQDLKPSTFDLFETQFTALPFPPVVAAYVFTYAEFLLPICLVLGFASRFSALLLLAMTLLIQVYVAPDAFWTAHAYLIAILAVLISVGPGAASADAILRWLSRL